MNLDSLIQSNILETLGLMNSPRGAQDKAINDAKDIILQSARNRVENLIPEDAREEFEQVFQEGAENECKDFLNKYGINVPDIIAQETLRYKYITQIINE